MGTTQVRVEVLRALHPIHACAAWHCICRIPSGCTCTCPAASLRTRCCFRLAMSIPDSNPAYARRPAHPQLKLQCRKLGIPRWPYRRLKSIRNMARTCETTAMRANSSVKRQLQAWASQLHALEVSAERVYACSSFVNSPQATWADAPCPSDLGVAGHHGRHAGVCEPLPLVEHQEQQPGAQAAGQGGQQRGGHLPAAALSSMRLGCGPNPHMGGRSWRVHWLRACSAIAAKR